MGVGSKEFPEIEAANVAMRACRDFLDSSEENRRAIDRIVFAIRSAVSHEAYERFAGVYFPPVNRRRKRASKETEGGPLVPSRSAVLAIPDLPSVPDEDEDDAPSLPCLEGRLLALLGQGGGARRVS